MTLDIKIRGPFLGSSGYDHHVRDFTRELVRQGAFVELVDLPEWGPAKLPAELRDPWFETLTAPSHGKLILHFTLPTQVVPEPGRINVNFTMFEATRIPPTWVEAAKRVELVILPTQSSRKAWLDSGVPPEKLRLCPLGVGAGYLKDRVPPMDIVFKDGRRMRDYKMRFLNVSEIGPRKNLSGLLRAWMLATTRDDDAVLVLKLGAQHPGSLAQFHYELAEVERELGKRISDAAPMHTIHSVYPDADMPRLFASASHYVSTSFGEGWDLGMCEAAAMDLKLIAPDHSAYRTYLDESVASLIPTREAAANFGDGSATGSLFEGANWWVPDQDAAVELIRRAVDGRDGRAESPRERIRASFTWQRATSRLIEILSEAERTAL